MMTDPPRPLTGIENGAVQGESPLRRWPPAVRRREPWERAAIKQGWAADDRQPPCVRRKAQPVEAAPALGAARRRRARRRQGRGGAPVLRAAAGLAAVLLAFLGVLAPNLAVDPGQAAHLPPAETAPGATATLSSRHQASYASGAGSPTPRQRSASALLHRPTSPALEVGLAEDARPSPPASSPTPTPTLRPAEVEATAWQSALGQAAATSYAIQTQNMQDYAATQTALPATVMALQTRMAATASAATATMQARYPTITYSPP